MSLCGLILAVAVAQDAGSPQAGAGESPAVIAGPGDLGDGRKAVKARLAGIAGLAVDPRGNLYIADIGHNRVRRVDARSGRIATVAGSGGIHLVSKPVPASRQSFLTPGPLALDAAGRTLYVAETAGRRVWKVDLETGELEDLGSPSAGFGQPVGLLTLASGSLLVVDPLYSRLWRWESPRWSEVPATSPLMEEGIRAVAEGPRGELYISVFFGHRILRWDAETGEVSVYVGAGSPGRSAEGKLARESLIATPDGLVADAAGNLYFSDMGNSRICKVDAETGRLHTVFQSPGEGDPMSWTPSSLALDRQGSFWIGDVRHNRVLRFLSGKKPRTVAGSSDIGDRGPATAAVLAHPGRVAVSAAGDVFISDALHHRVRRVDSKTGRITTVAGTGVPGYNGDGIPGGRAQLHHPGGVLVEGNDLYIADYYNNRVRRVDLVTGIISTLAGNGVAGELGDGGPAARARMLNPHALALDESGNLVVTSAVSPVIRRVELKQKLIDSIALDPRAVPPDSVRIFYGIARGRNGFFLADGMRNSVFLLAQGELKDVLPERQPDLNYPMDVAVSPRGELYICDTRNNRVVRWDGRVLRVVAEKLGRPRGITIDGRGQLYIADTFNNRVLKLRPAEGP